LESLRIGLHVDALSSVLEIRAGAEARQDVVAD
jgi:hypothetical protein